MAKFLPFALRFAGAALAAAALGCGAAHAGSDTDTFTVSATVLDSCSIDAADLDFGDYDPVAATPTDAASQISLTCTNGTAWEVALDEGEGAGATVSARRMADGAEQLVYALYTDVARTDVWGQTAANDTVAGVGTGAAQTLDVYGRIPAAQTAPSGDYEDTITVTVTY